MTTLGMLAMLAIVAGIVTSCVIIFLYNSDKTDLFVEFCIFLAVFLVFLLLGFENETLHLAPVLLFSLSGIITATLILTYQAIRSHQKRKAIKATP